jgi:hypothetical protein
MLRFFRLIRDVIIRGMAVGCCSHEFTTEIVPQAVVPSHVRLGA